MIQAVSNPVGRLDVLLVRVAEECTRRVLEPALSRAIRQPVALWDGMLAPVVEDAVKQLGIPERPITVNDVFALTAPKGRRRCTR